MKLPEGVGHIGVLILCGSMGLLGLYGIIVGVFIFIGWTLISSKKEELR